MKRFLSLIILFLLVLVNTSSQEDDGSDSDRYTNSWVVELSDSGVDADTLARTHGFVNMGQVGSLTGYYHFIDPDHSSSSTLAKRDSPDSKHIRLQNDVKVISIEQQVAKKRTKRAIVTPQDSWWSKQWYLHRNNRDMNVQPVWDQGITGKGVVVTILDDGIEHTHPDLHENYDPEASYDFNSHDSDPMPRYDPTNENKHGTRCAGEVASGLNSICSVGVAYHSKIGGVRMLDGDVTDVVEAHSLSFHPQHIDIYSSSWGPTDDGKTVDGPAKLAKHAFIQGINKGRNGKGSIFVWASGNGGASGDSCNCDGYAVSPYTVSIGSVTEHDNFPWYAEECSSNLASTYSSGSGGEKKVVSTDLHHQCTDRHTGTSAAAPMAAGLIALALEVRPDLTWRDVQYTIVYSSNPSIPHGDHWITNGAGLRVSPKYGFGLLDAAALVNRARHWVRVPDRQNCTIEVQLKKQQKSQLQVTVDITADNCPTVAYLEHVQAVTTLSINRGTRGGVQISLRSPSSTLATLLQHRRRDYHKKGLNDWPFMSVMTWGESPIGRWLYTVSTNSGTEFTLSKLTLILYGVPSKPVSISNIPKHCSKECKKGCSKAGPEYCDECNDKRVLSTLECVTSCPARTYTRQQLCLDCPRYCSQCTNDKTCIQCDNGYYKLPSGLCSSSCSQSSVFINGTCHSCHLTCKSCKGITDSDCTECHDSSQYQLVAGHCVFHANCSIGQYFEHRILGCKTCHQSCLECKGRDDTDCLSCSSPLVLVNGRCVEESKSCLEGEYYSNDTKACATCPPGCQLCYDAMTCAKCDSNSFLYSALLEHSDIVRTFCVGACPTSYYGDAKSRNCTLCSSECRTCFGDASNCTACVQTGAIPTVNGFCPFPCPVHQFYNYSSNQCQACISNCSSCHNSTYCTACTNGYYLNADGMCQPHCSNSTVQNPLTGRCEATQCHHSCLSCLGPAEDECLSCVNNNSILFQNICRVSCPKGYYKTDLSSCAPCHSWCEACSGPTEGECLTCSGDRPYYDQFHCLSSCRSGYYASNNYVCQPCSYSCAVCTDSTKCLQCRANRVLSPDGQCVLYCPHLYSSNNGLCQPSPTLASSNKTNSTRPTRVYEEISSNSWTVFILFVTCLLVIGMLSIGLLLLWKRKDIVLTLTRNRKQYVVLYPRYEEMEMNGIAGSESETEIFARTKPT